jgi:hypothetical protein
MRDDRAHTVRNALAKAESCLKGARVLQKKMQQDLEDVERFISLAERDIRQVDQVLAGCEGPCCEKEGKKRKLLPWLREHIFYR